MPQDLYCWRCDRVLPMLTDEEWQSMEPLLMRVIEDVQRHRVITGDGLAAAMQSVDSLRALSFYERLTGFREANPNALWHHRASLYGPPCTNCGKPLRTPQASYCPACGAKQSKHVFEKG
ncbi:hypothetical protein ASE43_17540 [Lysobacter sp. Root983]|nr:hypothetical protein ASE43_17540 [Lysobacter sp. Root983]